MEELRNFDPTQPQNFRYLLCILSPHIQHGHLLCVGVVIGLDRYQMELMEPGKTICLHQVLHYCVKAGWLVVFIPGGLEMLQRSLSLSVSLSLPAVFSWTHSDRELRPSARVPGTFDQPEAATAWLKAFRTLNSHFTAQV